MSSYPQKAEELSVRDRFINVLFGDTGFISKSPPSLTQSWWFFLSLTIIIPIWNYYHSNDAEKNIIAWISCFGTLIVGLLIFNTPKSPNPNKQRKKKWYIVVPILIIVSIPLSGFIFYKTSDEFKKYRDLVKQDDCNQHKSKFLETFKYDEDNLSSDVIYIPKLSAPSLLDDDGMSCVTTKSEFFEREFWGWLFSFKNYMEVMTYSVKINNHNSIQLKSILIPVYSPWYKLSDTYSNNKEAIAEGTISCSFSDFSNTLEATLNKQLTKSKSKSDDHSLHVNLILKEGNSIGDRALIEGEVNYRFFNAIEFKRIGFESLSFDFEKTSIHSDPETFSTEYICTKRKILS